MFLVENFIVWALLIPVLEGVCFRFGTSVPSVNELKTVKHHFIQHMSVVEDYSIGNYEKDCIKIINEKFKINDLLIMTGGSGMYADSVLYGLDKFPHINKKIRNNLISLFRKKGIGYLQELIIQQLVL